MQLHETSLGELYLGLSPEELRSFELYLGRQVQDRKNTVYRLHRFFHESIENQSLSAHDSTTLRTLLFPDDGGSVSKLTTYINLLSQHIKEFLILSKIKEKNIYTETLWGELLIERGMKRNLLMKLASFKYDLYKDEYALLKRFLNKREEFFYKHLVLDRKSYLSMIEAQREQIQAFNDYYNYYLLELNISLDSLAKQNKEPYEIDIENLIHLCDKHIDDKNPLIRIQALTLKINLQQNVESYLALKDLFLSKFNEFSDESLIQMFPTLINFGTHQVATGKENYEKENYYLFLKLYQSKKLFLPGFFSIIRLFTLIKLELRFGTTEVAYTIFNDIKPLVPKQQKESFENLIRSRIAYAEGNYKEALRYILSINPSDSIYYFPQYKIMLIKCHIELNDVERLAAESENFYRYLLHNKKRIPDDAQQRYKLFIKYAEYMTEARYPYLSDYMLRRVENALHIDAPYFTEKECLRDRWGWLKKKFGRDT